MECITFVDFFNIWFVLRTLMSNKLWQLDGVQPSLQQSEHHYSALSVL